MKPSAGDSQLIIDAKNNVRPYFLLNKLENKDLLTSIYHKMAIYMHPSMKNMPKISPDERSKVVEEVLYSMSILNII